MNDNIIEEIYKIILLCIEKHVISFNIYISKKHDIDYIKSYINKNLLYNKKYKIYININYKQSRINNKLFIYKITIIPRNI